MFILFKPLSQFTLFSVEDGRIRLAARSRTSPDDRRRDRENAFGRVNANGNHLRYWVSNAVGAMLEKERDFVLICHRDRSGFQNGASARNANEIGFILDTMMTLLKMNQFRNGQQYDSFRNDSAADISGLEGGRSDSRYISNAHRELYNRSRTDIEIAFKTDNVYQYMRDCGRYKCIQYMSTGAFVTNEKEAHIEVFLREVLLLHSGLFEPVSSFSVEIVVRFSIFNTISFRFALANFLVMVVTLLVGPSPIPKFFVTWMALSIPPMFQPALDYEVQD